MRCSASSTGLEIFFPRKIISHLSFCFAWLVAELWQIILMRFISLRGEQGGSVERVPAQRQIKQGSHVKGVVGVEINMAHVLSMRSFVFGVRGNIFCFSDVAPKEERNQQPKLILF